MAIAVYFHPKGMTLKEFEESSIVDSMTLALEIPRAECITRALATMAT
jgi:hypothetical protein